MDNVNRQHPDHHDLVHVILDDTYDVTANTSNSVPSVSPYCPQQQRYYPKIREHTLQDFAHERSVHNDNERREMYCCCFATADMPKCCMAAAYGVDTTGTTTNQPPRHHQQQNDIDASILPTEMIALQKAIRVTRMIGSAMIKRKAVSINRQLLQLQQMNVSHRRDDDNDDHIDGDEEEVRFISPSKKRRVDPTYSTSTTMGTTNVHKSTYNDDSSQTFSLPHDTSVAAVSTSSSSTSGHWYDNNDTTKVSSSSTSCYHHDVVDIWEQVNQMKRMSMFLKNAQLALTLLYEEINDCSTHFEGDK